jgi:flagellum-specific peptidoglycan hydrolase FlgJ
MFFYERAKYPEIKVSAQLPLAQACVESGNFASHVFEEFNNCLGMKVPGKRPTTAANKSDVGVTAHYDSVLDGIEDYILWLKALDLTTDEKLLAFIKAGKYAEDKKYFQKVTAMSALLAKQGAYLDYNTVLAVAGLGIVGGVGAGVLAYDKLIK